MFTLLRFITGPLLLWLMLPAAARAQSPAADTTRPARPFLLTLRIGANGLFGDLSRPQLGGNVGVSLSKTLLRGVALGLAYDAGRLRADETGFYNSYARTRFGQAVLFASADLTELFGRRPVRTHVSLDLGAGLMYFSAQAFNRQTDELQRFTNDQFSRRTRADGVTARGPAGIRNTREFVVPVGLRVGRAVTDRFTAFLEARYQFVRSDKLDATVDGDRSSYLEPNGGNIYGPASRHATRDSWAALNAGVTYRFDGLRERAKPRN